MATSCVFVLKEGGGVKFGNKHCISIKLSLVVSALLSSTTTHHSGFKVKGHVQYMGFIP